MAFQGRSFSVQVAGATVSVYGLLMYRDLPAGEESAKVFAQDFFAGAASFAHCTGAYRLQIACPDGRTVYMGDAAGLLRYYIHEPTGGFYTTLAEAAAQGEKKPCADAVAQFLYYGCVYGTDTVVSSVKRTDPDFYYVAECGKVTAHSKGLTPLDRLDTSENALREQMQRLAAAVGEDVPVACTITGGTDSRAILAHMLHNGRHPLLTSPAAQNTWMWRSQKRSPLRWARSCSGFPMNRRATAG